MGHGCKGSATTGLHVMLPEGFRGARPIVKPGWAINAPNVRLTQPYQSHGKPVDEDVNTVTFNGGPLRDAYYDEFVIFGKLPDAPSKLYFNVLHQCAVGSSSWMETPAPGTKAKFPAAVLEVLPAKNPAHAEHKHSPVVL